MNKMIKARFLRNKKGLEHVEVIVSFLIFITFIIFLILILNPFKTETLPNVLTEDTLQKIKDYTKTNFSYISLNVDYLENCFAINNIKDEKVIVKDERGNTVKAEISGNKLLIEKTTDFYFIFYSGIFEENTGLSSCASLNESEYELGILRSVEVYSLEKFKSLEKSYELEYNSLKNRLRITNDFGFILKNTQGEEILKAIKKPEGISIRASELPLQIIDENANMNLTILNVQVW